MGRAHGVHFVGDRSIKGIPELKKSLGFAPLSGAEESRNRSHSLTSGRDREAASGIQRRNLCPVLTGRCKSFFFGGEDAVVDMLREIVVKVKKEFQTAAEWPSARMIAYTSMRFRVSPTSFVLLGKTYPGFTRRTRNSC